MRNNYGKAAPTLMDKPEMSNVRREIAFPGRIWECDLRRRDRRERVRVTPLSDLENI